MALIYLHAGMPRTASTVLQRHVFPALKTVAYVGKNADNVRLKGAFDPVVAMDLASRRLVDEESYRKGLYAIVPTLLSVLSDANARKQEWQKLALMVDKCLRAAAGNLGPILYSDESLSESISGLFAILDTGDGVPLEQLHQIGFLENCALSIVLREPLAFLAASYYKCMELRTATALSFDEYIRRQLVIYERSPMASRIFPCLHQTATAHYQRLCPRAVVVDYHELIETDDVIRTLFGITGEEPVTMASLPRENGSWRNPEINARILATKGVPSGIAINAYAASFTETLQRYGLDRMIARESRVKT